MSTEALHAGSWALLSKAGLQVEMCIRDSSHRKFKAYLVLDKKTGKIGFEFEERPAAGKAAGKTAGKTTRPQRKSQVLAPSVFSQK